MLTLYAYKFLKNQLFINTLHGFRNGVTRLCTIKRAHDFLINEN